MLGIIAVMAAATYTRYYFVSWLGERVIADLRRAVFDHLLRLPPGWFELARTGEVISRLTNDTTMLETVIGSSASMAARNLLFLIGGLVMLAITSPKLTLWCSPGCRSSSCRSSCLGGGSAHSPAKPRIASPTSAPKSRRPERDSHGSGLRSRGSRPRAFCRAVEDAFRTAMRVRATRDAHRDGHHPGVRLDRPDPMDRRSRCCRRGILGRAVRLRVLCRLVASSAGAISEVRRSAACRRGQRTAHGAAVAKPISRRRRVRGRCPCRRAARRLSPMSPFVIPRGRTAALVDFDSRSQPEKSWRSSALRAPARPPCFNCSCASTIRKWAPCWSMASICGRPIPPPARAASASCPRSR